MSIGQFLEKIRNNFGFRSPLSSRQLSQHNDYHDHVIAVSREKEYSMFDVSMLNKFSLARRLEGWTEVTSSILYSQF